MNMKLLPVLLLAAASSALKLNADQQNVTNRRSSGEYFSPMNFAVEQAATKKRLVRKSERQYLAPPLRAPRNLAASSADSDDYYSPYETRKASRQYLPSNDFRQAANQYELPKSRAKKAKRFTTPSYQNDYDSFADSEQTYPEYQSLEIKKSKAKFNPSVEITHSSEPYYAPSGNDATDSYLSSDRNKQQFTPIIETKSTNGYTSTPSTIKSEIKDSDNYPESFKEMLNKKYISNSDLTQKESEVKVTYSGDLQNAKHHHHDQTTYEYIPSVTVTPTNIQFTSPQSTHSTYNNYAPQPYAYTSGNQFPQTNQAQTVSPKEDHQSIKKSLEHSHEFKTPIAVNSFEAEHTSHNINPPTNYLPTATEIQEKVYLPAQNTDQFLSEYIPENKDLNSKYLPPLDIGTVYQDDGPSEDAAYTSPMYLPPSDAAQPEYAAAGVAGQSVADRRDDNTTYRQYPAFNPHQQQFNQNPPQANANKMPYNEMSQQPIHFPEHFSKSSVQSNPNHNSAQPIPSPAKGNHNAVTYSPTAHAYTQAPSTEPTHRSDSKYYNMDQFNDETINAPRTVEIGKTNIAQRWKSEPYTMSSINDVNSFDPMKLNNMQYAQPRQSESSSHGPKNQNNQQNSQHAAARSNPEKPESLQLDQAKHDSSGAKGTKTPGVYPAQFQLQHQNTQQYPVQHHQPQLLPQQQQQLQQPLLEAQATYATGYEYIHPAPYSPAPYSPSFHSSTPYVPRPVTDAVPILKQTSEMALDGSFSYETLTGDQTHVMQQGHIENLGTDNEEQVIHGSYSFVGDDGLTYTVTYVADSNGFRASGDHLPTAPPIPEVIQRSIEHNLAEEAIKASSLYQSEPNSYPNDYQSQPNKPTNYQPQNNPTPPVNYQDSITPNGYQTQAESTASTSYQPFPSGVLSTAESQGASSYPKDNAYRYQNAIN